MRTKNCPSRSRGRRTSSANSDLNEVRKQQSHDQDIDDDRFPIGLILQIPGLLRKSSPQTILAFHNVVKDGDTECDRFFIGIADLSMVGSNDDGNRGSLMSPFSCEKRLLEDPVIRNIPSKIVASVQHRSWFIYPHAKSAWRWNEFFSTKVSSWMVIVNLRIEFHSCDEYLLAVGRRR
jgi:hypothetical protein